MSTMTNPAFDPTEWITTNVAAELTGYDYAHIRRMARLGQLPAMKLGRDWLVHRPSLLEHLQTMAALGPAKHDPRRRAGSEPADGAE